MLIRNVGNSNMGKNDVPEMAEEIQYSKSNKLLLNNISEWYIFEKQSVFGFPLLKKYENVLKADLIDYELDKAYHYKPEYLSNELYGTTDLWYLLLFVNDMQTVDQFNTDTVKVFTETVINDLNKIINSENDVLGSETNPKPIYKHMIKSTEEDSDRVTPKYRNPKIIPFVPELDFDDKLEDITSDRYLRERYEVHEHKFYRPDTDKKELVEPFTLNNDGLKTLPHLFYKKGFSRKFKGKMYFKPGEKYLFAPLQNGTSKLNITDSKGFNIINATENYQFKAPTAIFDLRKANDEDVQHSNLESTRLSSVSFNKETGLYEVKGDMFSKSDKEEGDSASFVKITLDDENENPRMNIKRLLKYDFFAFNLGYSTNFKDNNHPTAKLVYDITLTSNTGKVKKVENIFPSTNKNYNTQGQKSYLKHMMYNMKNIKKMEIEVKLTNFNNEVDPNEIIQVSLDELEIAGISHEEFNNTFIVTKEDWYDVELEYNYSLKNPDGSQYFFDESRSGIFFNPMIVALRSYGTYPVDTQTYTGFYNKSITKQSLGNYGYISFKDGTTKFDDDSLNYVYSQNFKFPKNYIMTFKVINKNNTGGAGIVFDYNSNLNSGYMLWIASQQENWDVPYFDLDDKDVMDDPDRVMKTGFYEIDKVFGKPKEIFQDEKEKQLYVTNHVPLDINNKYIKIIKNENRIRIFIDKNKDFNYKKPDVDIKDIENINMEGHMGFISAFSGLEVQFDSYYEYKDKYDD
ncbi:baseplate wedge [Staphylococcus phage vB_StaM_PB50]|nr:baseplate wedge [Staphylococcus phage vB_StaM_PB50]